jgi:hypothetical protein
MSSGGTSVPGVAANIMEYSIFIRRHASGHGR